MKRLGSILFWSVISAAFIGPGTVTTAASAGAGYGYSLLWALVFSTAACLTLQEASARITICSGHDLGQALRRQYPAGAGRLLALVVVLGAVVVGCAAYEAGNILGGAAGGQLATGVSSSILTLAIGIVSFGVLWFGRTTSVARVLGVMVAMMGAVFLYTAFSLDPDPLPILKGATIPRIPPGAGLWVLGLVGTTVVPYNLFLGSGLARGRELPEVRFGLSVAVILGGVVSAAIVVVGTAVDGVFGFESLAAVLDQRLGRIAGRGFAFGLAAAGISSAITAALAAAITVRGLLSAPPRHAEAPGGAWGDRGLAFRGVWVAVLCIGVGFGLAEVRPIPAILVAQALNGVLLPSVAVFLLLSVNDRSLMGERALNGGLGNACMVCVVVVTLALGVSSLARALAGALDVPPPGPARLLFWSAGIAALSAVPIVRRLRRLRRETAKISSNG